MDQKHQYQQRRARESVNTLFELSQLLNTGLDKRTLALCVSLCEQGVNPEVVAVSNFFFLFIYIKKKNLDLGVIQIMDWVLLIYRKVLTSLTLCFIIFILFI
jgi:mitotic-spindle organizing protein 1